MLEAWRASCRFLTCPATNWSNCSDCCGLDPLRRGAQTSSADLHLAAGVSLTEASEWAGFHYINAHRWVQRFLGSGVAGLGNRPKSGRPRAYGRRQTREILQVAAARPADLGLGFTTWSLPKLEQYLRRRPATKHLSRSTIRRRLREAGLRFRAGRTWCESGDPEFEVKKPHGDAVSLPGA